MADLKRRTESLRTQLDQARVECALLRSVVGWIDPEYAAALIDLADLALLDLRRPEDLGGPVTTNGAASRPPAYSYAAMNALKYDRKKQRDRAKELRKKLRYLVDQDEDPEDKSEGLHPFQVTQTKTVRTA